MAMQQSHCDMDNEEMSEMMSSDVQMVHDMSVMISPGGTDQSSDLNHDCCCCDNGCAGNCDMSIAASLIIKPSSYSPVILTAESLISNSPELQVRALTPPSRPPLDFS
jgi:hypothetical protein